ncbi:MAG: DUF1292 domain-containing protein [Bacillota bacterium]|nr:DUF1292 domain-containing protein [Bacillota bacterium]
MLDSNCLYVKDENGNEKKMTILFTFDNEETKVQYVVFQDPELDESQVYASRYDDQGQLLPIETEEEWEMVEEVINTFVEDDENA